MIFHAGWPPYMNVIRCRIMAKSQWLGWCVLILVTDLRGAIGFSSFGVLLYYLIANLAAYTQSSDRRRFPRILQIIGMVGCATLVLTLPLSAVLGGTLVFALGILYRAVRVRLRPQDQS